jgi:hypothetical protein
VRSGAGVAAAAGVRIGDGRLGAADEIGSGAWGRGADGGDCGTSAVAGLAGAEVGGVGLPRLAREVMGFGVTLGAAGVGLGAADGMVAPGFARMMGRDADAAGLSERGAGGRGGASSRLRQGLRVGLASAGKFWRGGRSSRSARDGRESRRGRSSRGSISTGADFFWGAASPPCN